MKNYASATDTAHAYRPAERLRASEVRGILGISYGELNRRLIEGELPKPDGHDENFPFWKAETIRKHLGADGSVGKTALTRYTGLRLHDPLLLGGALIKLIPSMARHLGSVNRALVLQQCLYWTNRGERRQRKSYSAIQRAIPFLSLRTIKTIVRELEEADFVQIERGCGVNCLTANMTKLTPFLEKERAQIVNSKLATSLGLNEAIALQQVHIRHHQSDGSDWVIRAFDEWAEVFPYWSVTTVKRTFHDLSAAGLVYVRTYRRDGIGVNMYRVNYIALADTLGMKLPDAGPPTPQPQGAWTHPAMPFSPVVKIHGD